MQFRPVKAIWILLIPLATLMMMCGPVSAQEAKAPESSPAVKSEPVTSPGLADLAQMATQLAESSTDLEKGITASFDLSKAEKRFARIQKKLAGLASRLDKVKSAERLSYEQLTDLKVAILIQDESLEVVAKPLSKSIRRLEDSQKRWLEARERWSELRSSPPKDVPLTKVKPTFEKAQRDINSALAAISKQLGLLVGMQQKAVDLQTSIYSLTVEVDTLLVVVRGDILRKSGPSIFSAEYYSELGKGLLNELPESLRALSWPEVHLSQRTGWLLFIQGLLSLIVIALILHFRRLLAGEERWRFMARRPFSSGILVGMASTTVHYGQTPATFDVVLGAVACIAIARVAGVLVTGLWRRRLIYGCVALIITVWLFQVFVMPLPIVRLYVFLVAVVGSIYCGWRTVVSSRSEDSNLQTGELGLACFMFMLVLIPELAGYSHLALYLLQAAIQTILILLATWILILAARGGLEFIIQSSPLKRFPIVQAKADVIVNRSALLANLFIFFLTITLILVAWRVYENPTQAIEHILQFGFDVGSRRVTVGLIFTAVALLYGAFLASWVVQAMLMAGVLSRRELQAGVRFSMARLVHYSLVVVGFLLALLALGVQFRDITIIGGALGVGIGFGLQSVVNNFVSGLILLFERPIKVGDYVEIAGQWGEIKRIGLRATIVETFDRSEVVVPNSELVSTRVTNWTLSHRIARLVMPVGVAYGSDVPLVMQTLKECAENHTAVMRSPASQILFRGFGDSSLNFELRVWISDVGKRLDVLSELHQEVDQRFRLAGVVIAFPQRDLHVRSVDESAASESSWTEEQRLRVVPHDDENEEQ